MPGRNGRDHPTTPWGAEYADDAFWLVRHLFVGTRDLGTRWEYSSQLSDDELVEVMSHQILSADNARWIAAFSAETAADGLVHDQEEAESIARFLITGLRQPSEE